MRSRTRIPPADPSATPGERRDCAHPHGRHQHGTRAAYVADRCRCPACRHANRAAGRARSRAIAYGRWEPYVDADPARRHINQLRAAGLGLNQIIALSGVGSGTIRHLVYGNPRTGRPVRRIRPHTHQRILTVRPGQPANGSLVDPAPAQRRLQALIATGWSLHRLADHLDRTPASLRRSLTSTRVTAATSAAVSDLYDRLEHLPPPQHTQASEREVLAARAYARDRGWRPALAWDDIDAQSRAPRTEPAADEVAAGAGSSCGNADDVDEIAVERAMRGDRVVLTREEQQEAARRLTSLGLSLRQIAGRLGISCRTVSRCRRSTHAA